jgi:PAS domain S-box-containing protein
MPSIKDFDFIHHESNLLSAELDKNRRSKSRRISDELFRLLVDAMNEGVIILNNHGDIIYVNTKFCNLLGSSYDELTGKPVIEFIDNSSMSILKKKFLNCIRLSSTASPPKATSIGVTWNNSNGETIFSRVSPQLLADSSIHGKVFFAVVTDITESKKARESLIQSQKELHSLSNKLLTAQERERKRIAGELHDGIGQCLSAIKFKIEEIVETADKNAKSFESLNVLVPLLQNATAEVRRIAMDLRPSILDDLGLKATVNWLSREYRAIYSSIELDASIEVAEAEISEILKTVLYRVIQESLNNIAKHAQATRLTITLMKIEDKINLSITDNGIGFSLDANRTDIPASIGLGLSSMKERVELTRGTFNIQSVLGEGTVINASWAWETQIKPLPPSFP